MPHQKNGKNDGRVETDDEQPFRDQLRMMQRAFTASPVRNMIIWLAIGIIAVILATAVGQIVLNRWYKPFYDTLERRDLPAFLMQLVVFAQIAGVLLILNVLQTWLSQWIRIKLREGLTLDLINEWMKPARAFRLANAGSIGINPDQRVHEDARHLADLTAGLTIGLFQSGILLASFVGVLWSLSAGFVFHIGEYDLNIPGYMVWAAFLYAATAATLSWFVGRPLVKINGEHYSREAALRFSLMRVNEHIEAVSLSSGEANEKRRLQRDLASVLEISSKLMLALTRLTWVTSGYGWITVVAPIVIAAPVYFNGDLSFGGLMMAVGAFNQVNTSLRWFVDNIDSIADWRATLLRVAAFRSAILMTDERHENDKRIEFAKADGHRLTIDRLEIALPSGCIKLADQHVEIRPGDRVLVTSAADVEKAPFFRSIAGLWPWGHGRIALPDGDNMAFVPRTPYFPPGTLEEVLCYPESPGRFKKADMMSVLSKVGLGKLNSRLDQDMRTRLKLNELEMRLLSIARLGLHKPRWIIIDEALDTLERDAYHTVLSFLEEELGDAAVVNIGRMVSGGRFFTRVLQLRSDPAGNSLRLLRPKSLRTPNPQLAD
ncbi:ABC transporter ATP-binding protein/permease [Pararhizobium sp. BT-229]|uniref:ABC transporter ATP-binding protein/permease n=1 Tax=Pararhizobium sp. BT-229 TaxID=2986923 RepID=UPI0021F6D256|nr:ABC transporter ATP-binding protein/permease [Pararhizobium sp. BT-229]MCV9962752.1 ABC transporter ATP-binding protein/permease [Pararhizobium sp. BT-229]